MTLRRRLTGTRLIELPLYFAVALIVGTHPLPVEL